MTEEIHYEDILSDIEGRTLIILKNGIFDLMIWTSPFCYFE